MRTDGRHWPAASATNFHRTEGRGKNCVVEVAVEPDKPSKSVTIRITHPNSCSLKYDDMDLKLREMLAASGIEPREPAHQETVQAEIAKA